MRSMSLMTGLFVLAGFSIALYMMVSVARSAGL